MRQVDLIRRYTLKQLRGLRIFISCLPEREQTALEKLSGPEGIKTAARISDFILEQLGHPAPQYERETPSIKAARQVVGSSRRA